MEKVKSLNKWDNNEFEIKYYYNGNLIFYDTIDHWINGFCRLLGLSEEDAKKWVENVASESLNYNKCSFQSQNLDDKIKVLKKATSSFFCNFEKNNFNLNSLNNKIGPCGHYPDMIWGNQISDSDLFSIIGCRSCQHGWLVLSNEDLLNKGLDRTNYDCNYFEGARKNIGYGSYLSQKPWRIEKSRRLVKKIEGLNNYSGIKLKNNSTFLDIGSGYGYFRKAIDEKGWYHEGIELSEYAIEMCNKEFGFKTFLGTIEQYAQENNKKFDVITMWDTLEHVENPQEMLKIVKSLLNKNGVCYIRTPNIKAFEREILGKYFYSLKQEHLQYFSPKSLLIFLRHANLTPVFIDTESHYFKGFLNDEQTIFERLLKGSDIIALAINEHN